MDKSKKAAVRNLLLVVGSAVLFAFLFSGLLLYKYSPDHPYNIENSLISPDMVSLLKFNDKNSKTGGQSRFIFDKIEFEYLNPLTRKKEKRAVSQDAYTYFYQMAISKKNVTVLTDEIRNSFNKGQPAALKIWIKTESSAPSLTVEKVFQEIDFASSGGYFRVELREADPNKTEPFAYFYAPEMYQKILALFGS